MDASESLGPEEQLTVPEAALLPFGKPIWLSTLSALDLSACWALIRRWAYSRKLGSIISDCIPRNYIKWHTGTYEGPRRDSRSQNYPPCPAGPAVWYTNNPIAARLTLPQSYKKPLPWHQWKHREVGKHWKHLEVGKHLRNWLLLKDTSPQANSPGQRIARAHFFPAQECFHCDINLLIQAKPRISWTVFSVSCTHEDQAMCSRK